MPDLPAGVTDRHFVDLGSIEVLVLRCSSRNVDETNESTTSSAAQSDILEALEHDLEAKSTTDDENDKKRSAKPKKASAKPAKEEADEALPFAGLFDGPSDDGRAPYLPPDPEFGHWDWPSHHRPYPRQRGYGPRHDGTPGGYGNAPYPGLGPSNVQNPRFGSEQYPKPPPADNHPPRFEKRVHFDYGFDQGPAADHARYWDGHERPSSCPRAPPYPNDKYYTPGLSEWYGSRPDGFDQGPKHGYVPHAYNIHDGAYRAYDLQQSGPPQYQYPPYHSGMQGNVPPPSPGAYARWTGAQPAPPWSTHPVRGVPHPGPPRYYHPQAPPYQPYAGTPYPNAAWGKPDGGQDERGQGQDGFQNSGSLDPAKDENNANDTNQTGDGNKQDELATNNDINNTNNTNDNNGNQRSSDWPNGDNSNNTGNTNNGNHYNDANEGGDSNKGDDWANNTGNQGTAGWENNNDQNNTTQGNWDNSNNNASNAAGGGDAWGDNSRKASATLSQTAGSSIRPLYGPHGAYYAMQFASASAPDIACDAEEEPRYDVPKPYVDDTGSTKQVQPGKGYLYYKKQCHPEYIDQLEEPYAKFVFQYMTKNQVQKELSINLDTEPSGNPEVQIFQNMAKDDLIQMLIRAKGALGGEIPPPPPASTNPTEGAFIKGVPIDPPRQVFLDYDIPLRGGNGGGGAKGATTSASGGNDGWAAPNNSTNNATNDSWETKPTNNNNGNAAGGDSGSGANDWSNTNSGSCDKSDPHPKQQFPKESWAAAQEQQKSGPPPAPPARPEPQANNAATGDGWDIAPSGGAEAPAPGGGW